MFFESFLINLTVILVLIIALIFDYVTKFFSYWYVRHIPYKSSVPFFGSDYHRVLGLRSSTDEVNQLYAAHSKHRFAGRVMSRIPDLIVKDPDFIKRVLSTDFGYFHSRGISLSKSQDVCIRNNLFYADGEKWTLLRQALESLLSNMNGEFDLHECLSGTNGDTNVQSLLSVVLDYVFKELLLGDDGSALEEVRSMIQQRTLVDRFKSYLKNIFPSLYILFGLTTIPGQQSRKINEQLKNSKLMKLIRNVGHTHQLGLNDKDKGADVDFALSTLALFITEGYIPCLNLLTALLYELALSPEIQEKARNSVSKDNSEDYLDVTIKEALRLHPPYSMITRQCVKLYQHPESSLVIDKRVTVNVPVEAIHKDEEHYLKADSFNPDRFLDDESSTKHCYAYLPFGAGPRKCIGEQLSLQIIRNVVKTILANYELTACDRTAAKLPMADHNFGRIVDQDIWLRFKPKSVSNDSAI